MTDNDTICAIATAQGGAIGLIRISGNNTFDIVDKIFIPANGVALKERKPYTIAFGHISNGKETIDEVLVSIFHAPHSYTGENAVEISCHGSSYILQQTLHSLIDNGCRQAQPGEFTQRAFMNGKMDLSQAEAVADLIASTNRATHKMALGQLRGDFSTQLAVLRDKLLKVASLLELELDFSDQDVNFADRKELLSLAQEIDQKITTLAQSFKIGQTIKAGVPVAIVGKTNVGKSTLLNQLLHDDKAIVSDVHGTTRDVIEDITQINGVTFRFIDTAGLRHTDDTVERLGIERTYKKLDEATVIIWLIDEQPTDDEIKDMTERVRDKQMIVALNKIDKNNVVINIPAHTCIPISAKQNTNIDSLEDAIYKAANIPEIKENDVIVTNARHYQALTKAHTSIARVIEGLQANLSGDLIVEDLRIGLSDLAEITGGLISSQEVLQSIFSHFCIGK